MTLRDTRSSTNVSRTNWRRRCLSKSVLELPAHDHYVYVAWGTDKNRPLYVGKSRSLLARLGQHSQNSLWWHHLTRLAIYSYDSEREALRAEAEAIAEYQPEYNRAGVSRPMSQPISNPGPPPSYGPPMNTDDLTADHLAIIARVQRLGRPSTEDEESAA